MPRTNKRFLTSIIKNTDDHNKTILKAQAAAAQELKRERDEQERRERRARAAEAAEAEKLRRRSKRKRVSEDEYWDRWDGRTADRKRTSSRNWDDNWSGHEEGDRSRRKRRRRTEDHPKSRSREPSSRVPSHHSSPSPRSRSRSRELSSRGPSHHPSPSPGPQPPVQLPSKMDRYFEESYDPRLDVAPLSAPKVPATGLINNAEFEGWDAMLELIRVRREDKEEKKRLDRLGLSKEKVKIKKNLSISSSVAVADRWSSEGVSVLDIEYNKRGSVREWDLGKEI